MHSAPIRILIVAALCVAGLIGLVMREGMARDSGTEVLLAMEAVDPRSLLSGHYVVINLREVLDDAQRCPTDAYQRGWIALSPDGQRHRFAGLAADRDAAARVGAVVVRGEVDCSEADPPEGEFEGRPGWVSMRFGINRFHINQAEAQRIERVLGDQRLGEEARMFAIVSVGADGRARLKGLTVDGERLELTWL